MKTPAVAAYRYRDPFIAILFEDIGRLILGEDIDRAAIRERLFALTVRNSPITADYWRRTEPGCGIPDIAFKCDAPYFFSDRDPARTFSTSGTTGAQRGTVSYSPQGLELMNLSILENARRHIIAACASDPDGPIHAGRTPPSAYPRPAIIRLVPSTQTAPHSIIAYGMELIADTLGDPDLSDVVIDTHGVDFARLEQALQAVIRAGVPAVLIGASFAFVNVCEALEQQGKRFALPTRSRLVDAGGFKGRSRTVSVAELRALAGRTFGIAPAAFLNIFGMTELASQLYDACDVAVGPLGQRPKGRLPFIEPSVRDPNTMRLCEQGFGLLEVLDLCVLDRPCVVLTGDLGIAAPPGVAIIGRVAQGLNRGCSVSIDELTKQPHIGCETPARQGGGDPPAERTNVPEQAPQPTTPHRTASHNQGNPV